MAFSRVKAAGWAYGEILTSSQMNSLDIDHANAIDGANGGTYNLLSPIDISGSDVSIDQLTVPSVLTVNGNAAFNGSTTAIGNSSGDALNVVAQATFTAALTANADVTLGNASSDTLTINATSALNAPMVPSGTGRVPKRIKTGAADANTSYGPKDWDIVVVTTLTADRDYTIDDTGAVNGDVMLFINQSGTSFVNLKDPGGSTITSYGGALARDWVVVRRVSGSWSDLLTGKRL